MTFAVALLVAGCTSSGAGRPAASSLARAATSPAPTTSAVVPAPQSSSSSASHRPTHRATPDAAGAQQRGKHARRAAVPAVAAGARAHGRAQPRPRRRRRLAHRRRSTGRCRPATAGTRPATPPVPTRTTATPSTRSTGTWRIGWPRCCGAQRQRDHDAVQRHRGGPVRRPACGDRQPARRRGGGVHPRRRRTLGRARVPRQPGQPTSRRRHSSNRAAFDRVRQGDPRRPRALVRAGALDLHRPGRLLLPLRPRRTEPGNATRRRSSSSAT